MVAVISGSGQTVADRYGYDSYGNTTYASVTVPNPFGYAGGYTDPTGLILLGARYYDPSTARWTQVDPEANGTSTAYAYANGDPVGETDPSGLSGTEAIYRYWWGSRIYIDQAVTQRLEIALQLAAAGFTTAAGAAGLAAVIFAVGGNGPGAILAALVGAFATIGAGACWFYSEWLQWVDRGKGDVLTLVFGVMWVSGQ